eukprot:Hpha_TRINITY_DN16792_c2_g7::TRINITY_DN16792_c2_g7_i1::g.77278::m.77278
MIYLNEYGKQVGGVVDISPFDGPGMEREMKAKGITKATKRPVFIEQEFTATKSCLAWRATVDCTSQGAREPPSDLSCTDTVPADKSGYCQCSSGIRLNFDCEEGRPPFTCDEFCQEPLED